jgi:hypothetical protein
MKLPVDRTWAIAITMVVTYAITVAILLIERRSGEPASGVPAASSPAMRRDAQPLPATPRRTGPQGLPAPGGRSRPVDPAPQNPG